MVQGRDFKVCQAYHLLMHHCCVDRRAVNPADIMGATLSLNSDKIQNDTHYKGYLRCERSFVVLILQTQQVSK